MAEGQEEDGALELDGLPNLAVAGSSPGPAEDINGVGVKAPRSKNASHVTRAAKKIDDGQVIKLIEENVVFFIGLESYNLSMTKIQRLK